MLILKHNHKHLFVLYMKMDTQRKYNSPSGSRCTEKHTKNEHVHLVFAATYKSRNKYERWCFVKENLPRSGIRTFKFLCYWKLRIRACLDQIDDFLGSTGGLSYSSRATQYTHELSRIHNTVGWIQKLIINITNMWNCNAESKTTYCNFNKEKSRFLFQEQTVQI